MEIVAESDTEYGVVMTKGELNLFHAYLAATSSDMATKYYGVDSCKLYYELENKLGKENLYKFNVELHPYIVDSI